MASPDDFKAVTSRLKLALGVESDLQLADRLGMSQSAWSNRKTRNSLPRGPMDELIAAEEINPEFVYAGKGPVHVPLEEGPWHERLHAQLRALLSIETYVSALKYNGYKVSELDKIAAGKAPASAEFLRDLRRHLKVDLNALLCDEQPLTAEEQGLLDLYRSAPQEGQRLAAALLSLISKR